MTERNAKYFVYAPKKHPKQYSVQAQLIGCILVPRTPRLFVNCVIILTLTEHNEGSEVDNATGLDWKSPGAFKVAPLLFSGALVYDKLWVITFSALKRWL